MTSKADLDALPFGKILSKLMKERQLTIQAIANLAGVNKSVVHGWMTGTTPHDLFAIGKLSRALGIGFRELLLGEPELPVSMTTLDLQFDKEDVFDGLCEVRIRRIVPKAPPQE
ncbi:MAG: helix-turn-helix transcriptional regulator [Betaproteobacteria bacterium]|nr:helix-turn-helix transcriptional regulator [Betaproteobacteria bacterium]